jgi:phage tail-like protein
MTDVNGTQHHLLLGAGDWHRCSSPGGVKSWYYDPEAEAVTLAPDIFIFPDSTGEPKLTPADRRGATRDIYGHWYWIDADGQGVRVRWAAAKGSALYWSADIARACLPAASGGGMFKPAEVAAPPLPENFAGLAATTGHYLVISAPDTGELLVFDLHTAGALPARISLPPPPDQPAGTLTHPFDLAPLHDGGVVVLDRDHKRAWVLDALLRPLTSGEIAGDPLLFQPESGDERAEPGSAAYISIDLNFCADPISIEPLNDGSFFVLDQGAARSTIYRVWLDNRPPHSVALVEANLREPADEPLNIPQIQGHDLAYVPGSGDGILYVVSVNGNQAFALSVTLAPLLKLRAVRKYYPLRGFTGRALVAPFDETYPYFDHGERWLPLAALPRPTYKPFAVLQLPTLDGRDPGCVWHRLCLDACIPPGTSVRVETRAADDLDDLAAGVWNAEPAPYQRHDGAEIPYYCLWSDDDLRDKSTGTWELLFQRAVGRYLDIRLLLHGDTQTTPVLRALRAHYPRFSYRAEYLPALYGMDAESGHFLETFLANPEGLLTTLEGMIADVQVFFDVRTTPDDALDWLAGWVGLSLDAGWTAYQRRLLIAHAPWFFLRRGTLPGLMAAIMLTINPEAGPDIFTDAMPYRCKPVRIVELYETRTKPGVVLGDPTESELTTSGDISADARTRAHRFTVLLPATASADQIRLVSQVVELEKPAHTVFTVRQYWALFRVGEARLGLDTILGEGGRFALFRLGETALAEGILGAAYPFDLSDRTVIGR